MAFGKKGVFGQGTIKPWTHEEMMKYGKIAGILVIVAIVVFAGWMYSISPPLIKANDKPGVSDQGGGPKLTPVPGVKEVAVAAGVAVAIADSAAANTGTPTVTATPPQPEDVWILKIGFPSPDDTNDPRLKERIFPIGETPTTISVSRRNTIYRNVDITAKKISGIAATESGTTQGTQYAIWIYFYKEGNFIEGFKVSTNTAKPGSLGNKFMKEFPSEVWSADSVGIIAAQ